MITLKKTYINVNLKIKKWHFITPQILHCIEMVNTEGIVHRL
jgi:hypothetical protein